MCQMCDDQDQNDRGDDAQYDKAYVLGAIFGWNCAVEEWEPSVIERGKSPKTWAHRDALRAERRKRFETALAARGHHSATTGRTDEENPK